VSPAWKIIQNNEIVAEGTMKQLDIPIGNGIHLSEVVYDFKKASNPVC
jgi:hypothetical protein